MNIDLNPLSLKELKDLHGQVAKAIAGFEDRKKKEALAALEEKARDLGFSLSELTGVAPAGRKRWILCPSTSRTDHPNAVSFCTKGSSPITSALGAVI